MVSCLPRTPTIAIPTNSRPVVERAVDRLNELGERLEGHPRREKEPGDQSALAALELVFDTVWVGGFNPPTLGCDQDQLWNHSGTPSGDPGKGVANTSGGASTEQADSTSVTMGWSRSPSGH